MRYLETFEHTLAVMQTRDGLRRVARECALDLAADGVVYAESRYAPEQHLDGGLASRTSSRPCNAGSARVRSEAAAAGTPIRVTALLTAMRHAAKSREIAELAVRYRDEGVAGFDIAGAEAGYPPTRHLDAFEYLRRENAHFTIHAGEAFGLPSIWEAIQWCGADRLGHGVRIVDDITIEGLPFPQWLEVAVSEGLTARRHRPRPVYLGLLAAYVRDRRIPLEMCPSSNIQTGAAALDRAAPDHAAQAAALPGHPQHRQPADERHVDVPRDASLLVDEAGWTLDDLRWVTVNAMKSAFLPFDERLALIERVVKPGYAALGVPTTARSPDSPSTGRARAPRSYRESGGGQGRGAGRAPERERAASSRPSRSRVAAPALGQHGSEHVLGVVARRGAGATYGRTSAEQLRARARPCLRGHASGRGQELAHAPRASPSGRAAMSAAAPTRPAASASAPAEASSSRDAVA